MASQTDLSMNVYDPDTAPAPVEWLELDEAERLARASAYHRRKRIRLPNLQLHAVIHVVIENQVALGDQVVASTLARLEAEGLSRHDAVHAIGSVLAERLFELMRETCDVTDSAYAQYLERLKDLTAARWRSEAPD
jgi:hypothetical protein